MAFVGVFLGAFFRRGCGHFIAICSTTAFRPSDRGVGYPASKTALAMTFRGMNLAYHDKNVIFFNSGLKSATIIVSVKFGAVWPSPPLPSTKIEILFSIFGNEKLRIKNEEINKTTRVTRNARVNFNARMVLL